MIAAHTGHLPTLPDALRHPPGRGVRRAFLGWDRPAIGVGADALLDRFGEDMGRVVVVTPVRRAGRVLLAHLADQAARRGLFLTPPRTTTPRDLAPELIPALRPARERAAPPVAVRLAWMDAIAGLDPDVRRVLAPGMAAEPSRRALAGAAALLEDVHDALTQALLTFDDVAAFGAGWFQTHGVDGEAERWRAAADAQRAYERRLAELGHADLGLERIRVLARLADDPPAALDAKPVVLFGAADLPRLARVPVALLADADPNLVEAFIFAPEGKAGLFDAFGCARATDESGRGWDREPAAPPEESVLFVDSPADQAEAALGTLAQAAARLGSPGRLSPHDAVIAAPDDGMPERVRRLGETHGIELHVPSGRPLRETAPWLLLDLAAGVLEDGGFHAVLALARHVDAERAIAREPGLPHAWLEAMDDHAADRLPSQAGDGDARDPDEQASDWRRAVAREVATRVRGLLGDLWTRRRETLPAHEIAEAGVALLARVYAGRTLLRRVPADRELEEALCAVRDALRGVPSEGGVRLAPAELLRLVLASCESDPIAEEPAGEAIEMVGWLDLPFDPAPAAVVVGFNEGVLPSGAPHDPFLPDGLRQRLGLECDRTRLARDVFLLAHLLRSRRCVALIAGRRGAEGDPLRPSRLLLRTEREGIVRTIRRFVGDRPSPEPPRLRRPGAPAGVSAFRIAPILDGYEPPRQMRVTGFRQFLAWPYGFYLTDILGLVEVGPPPGEMDALVFGTLIHRTLDAFARTDAAGSERADVVRDALCDELRRAVRLQFGEDLSPALWVQQRIAEDRLCDLAPWQAEQAREGWRIVRTEWKPDAGEDGLPLARLNVDGEPMPISGKIDRIDRHEGDGRLRIIDYKTGQHPLSPMQTHSPGRDGVWRDLQLPLYRHLAAALVDELRPPEDPALAYIVLPAAPVKDPLRVAEWDALALLRADEAAFDVVRRVRQGRFSNEVGRLKGSDTFTAIAGLGLLGGDDDEGEDAP